MKLSIERKSLIKTSLIFLILNTLISYIIAFKFLKYTGAIEGLFDFSYLAMLSLSHIFILTNLLAVIIIPLALLIPKKSLIRYSSILLSLVFIFVLFADAVAFEQYRFHINKFIIQLIVKGGKGVFNIDNKMYMIIAGIIILIAVAQYLIYKLADKLSRRVKSKQVKTIYIVAFSLYLVCNVMYAGASAYYYNPITKHNRLFPLYYPLTANRFLRAHFVNANSARENLMHSNINNTNLIYPKDSLVFGNSEKKNILILCIDSWRADCMSEEITPNICSLKNNSKIFNNHFSGSNGTRGGIFSIFYGIPSTYWDNMEANCISPVLLNSFQAKDYDFGVYACATLLVPAFDKTVFSNIKDIETQTQGSHPSEGDSIITIKFNKFIQKHNKEKNDKNFFGFVFFDSAHGYDLPKNFKTKFIPSLDEVVYLKLNSDYDKTEFYNRYKNCLYYIDKQIGKIIQELKDNNLFENTTILITGDHAQEFNDNHKNYWGHNGNFSQYQIKVPLVIYDKSYTYEKFEHKTSHYDIVPTLMQDLLKCKNPSTDYSVGKNLFEKKDWDYLISGSYMNFSIINDKQIITKYENGDFTATDRELNEISFDKVDFDKLNTIVKDMNSFYKK